MEQEKPKAGLWDWVKAISALILVALLAYKVYSTPITLDIDFPTLLSLLLALFSVALSALFYFKATETSNAFYDNTYKFTRDIAQLLVKIESHYCPVKLRPIWPEANRHAGFGLCQCVSDFNSKLKVASI